MKLPSKSNVLSSAVVLGLAAVLVTLAVLQYRWSGEVSDAASARMKASLQASMTSFRQELFREFSRLCLALQVNPDAAARARWNQYTQQYQSWSRTTAHPGLVAGIFLLEDAAGEHAHLLRLNTSTNQFEATEWPSNFERLPERLTAVSPSFAAMSARFSPPETARAGGSAHAGGTHEGARGVRRSRAAQAVEPIRRRPFGSLWAVEQNVPALLHVVIPSAPARGRDARAPRRVDWIIVQLDRKVLDENFHELAERYFAGSEGLEYNIAVLGGPERRRVVYSTDSEFAKNATAGADATMEFFGGPPGPGGPVRGMLLAVERDRETGAVERARADTGFTPRFEPVHYSPADKDWLLAVKHRKGSLDSVVAGMRRRSLTLSFGILLVLAATMAMVIIASQRAHRLAKLQMDFVTGVSHELRTPLAVISSAADNIADGVVDGKQQVMRYGAMIKKQARQLSQLVEQIMLFAATRQNGVQYDLRPLAVSDVVGAALNNTAELIHGAGFTVEQNIEPGLPPVMGELSALAQCLQNLITNAVKYGGQDRWIGIRARTSEKDPQEIVISIDDHGIGIDPADRQRIFEPFYRTQAVKSAQIHGSGLGLPLARSIAEAMGGDLSVSSEVGRGSSFTLHLPAAPRPAPAPEETVATSSMQQA